LQIKRKRLIYSPFLLNAFCSIPELRDFYLPCDLVLFFFILGKFNNQNTVFVVGADLFNVHILGNIETPAE